MREIKFRAWDNVKDQMYFVGEEEDVAFEIVGGKFVGYDAREEFDAPCFKMEHLKVMQYTGLKDKNGVEIYEGDVVELIEPSLTTELFHYDPAVIRFREYGFHLVQTDGEMDFLSNQRNNIRIIGNIYEHPHLLEVSE